MLLPKIPRECRHQLQVNFIYLDESAHTIITTIGMLYDTNKFD